MSTSRLGPTRYREDEDGPEWSVLELPVDNIGPVRLYASVDDTRLVLTETRVTSASENAQPLVGGVLGDIHLNQDQLVWLVRLLPQIFAAIQARGGSLSEDLLTRTGAQELQDLVERADAAERALQILWQHVRERVDMYDGDEDVARLAERLEQEDQE